MLTFSGPLLIHAVEVVVVAVEAVVVVEAEVLVVMMKDVLQTPIQLKLVSVLEMA